MMNEALQNNSKVIVVLSIGYKSKADSFTGGVGTEYALLLNDLDFNPQKYILVCFEKKHNDLILFGLLGREIIDLTLSVSMQTLYHKLMDIDQVKFSPVQPLKPVLNSLRPQPFVTKGIGTCPIDINKLTTRDYGYSSSGKKLTMIHLLTSISYSNTSAKVVNGLNYEIRIDKCLDPESISNEVDGEKSVIHGSIYQKIFKGQNKHLPEFPIEITSENIFQVLKGSINVTIFTLDGMVERIFKIEDTIQVYQNPFFSKEKVTLRKAFLGV